jgi:hypothetical protein
MVDEGELHDLLAIVPSEFVAARNARAKALKAAGDKDAAAALAALRRIHVVEWAMNVVAADDSGVVGDFADAAASVLVAQEAAMSGTGGGDLRAAMRTMRDRAADVVAAVREVLAANDFGGAGTSVAEVSARLSSIAANVTALELLRRGLLGADDPGLVDPFTAGGTAPAPERPAPAGAKRPASARRPRGASPPSEAPATVDLAAERARRRGATDATRVLEAANSDAELARRALERATKALAKAQRRVADAEGALAAAREALDAAVQDHEEAAARDAEAADNVVAAETALARFQP